MNKLNSLVLIVTILTPVITMPADVGAWARAVQRGTLRLSHAGGISAALIGSGVAAKYYGERKAHQATITQPRTPVRLTTTQQQR
ncbi:MAG TPA: hypothetical protein VLG71_00020 [Candidatus Limnocylindria bacterium]|nr:hypothetical protein [Candidatus Limnocylindria bacterium]